MKLKLLYWFLIGVIVLLSLFGLIKSCSKAREKGRLKQEIKKDEAAIKHIQQKRDSANAVRIPFSERGRDSVVESVNRKNGFGLSVRPQKSN